MEATGAIWNVDSLQEALQRKNAAEFPDVSTWRPQAMHLKGCIQYVVRVSKKAPKNSRSEIMARLKALRAVHVCASFWFALCLVGVLRAGACRS